MHYIHTIRLCVLAIHLLPLFGKAQTELVTISLDPRKQFQQIDGFGASDAWRCQFVGNYWPKEKKEAIADMLFSKELDTWGNPKGIGLSIWRFYIGAGTAEQGEASDIINEWRRADSFLDSAGKYDWSKQQGQQWFLNQAKKYGVERFLAFSISAPVFWTLNGKGYNTLSKSGINLQSDKFEAYTDFLIAVLEHFKTQNIHFDYLSPINEPQWDWETPKQEGTPATNEDISKLAQLLNKKMNAISLPTKIGIPEAADLRYLYQPKDRPNREDQINAFFNPGSNLSVRGQENVMHTVLGHSYFTTWPVDSLISIRQQLNEKLTKHNIDYWQSEFCILENTEDIGSGKKRDLGINTALYVARVIHADLTLANAKSWQWWTALTNADFKDGLIYLDTGDKEDMYNLKSLKKDGEFHDSKLLWAFGNFSRFVRPGMVRVHAKLTSSKSLQQQYEDFMISAYTNPSLSEVVVVAINYSESAKKLEFENQHILLEKMYITSKNENLEYHQIQNKNIELPAKSITTFIGTYTDEE